MGATTGFAAIGDYTTGSPVNKAVIDLLIALIPNPDAATNGTGAVAGGTQGKANTYLDEMTPACAAQILVELAAVKAAIENV